MERNLKFGFQTNRNRRTRTEPFVKKQSSERNLRKKKMERRTWTMINTLIYRPQWWMLNLVEFNLFDRKNLKNLKDLPDFPDSKAVGRSSRFSINFFHLAVRVLPSRELNRLNFRPWSVVAKRKSHSIWCLHDKAEDEEEIGKEPARF